MSRRIGLGQRICSGQSLFNMVNKTLILDLQTLFKVTVHLRLEALWRWRMNQNGLRGGKCSRQVISDWQIDRQTDQYRAPAEWGPNNQWIQTSINTFSTEFLLPSPFEFSQANFPLIFYNVCCKMLPLSWHSFDDIAKLITTCCPNDGLAMAVAVGTK